jgi:hypothetical protein
VGYKGMVVKEGTPSIHRGGARHCINSDPNERDVGEIEFRNDKESRSSRVIVPHTVHICSSERIPTELCLRISIVIMY